ncbi:MAG: hypothetical protein KJO79_07840 [Verrucomicrobiae bacterium]|nr:hypothetical protein [Verrucomicrobiae bacterium]NNJ87075.1 hypothetical protein [Akkermansiaceae bacterium]
MRCDLGAPRWIKPTAAEVKAHTHSGEKRTNFTRIASFTKGDSGFKDVRNKIQEGDVVAFRMTSKEKRNGLLHGNIKTFSYILLKYAHMAIVVRDPDDPAVMRLYTSQGARGPNIIDDIDHLEHHTIDVYRLNHWRQLDLNRLREFVSTSVQKKNKIFAYNFIGMVGIYSNHLEPHTPSEIGDDYMCSAAVAAALHYAGLDLDAVRCCEVFNMVSPLRVITSTGRIIPSQKMVTATHHVKMCSH